jgi:hypothetical protein
MSLMSASPREGCAAEDGHEVLEAQEEYGRWPFILSTGVKTCLGSLTTTQ